MIAFNKSKPEDLILQVKRLSKENAIAESDYNGLNNSTRTVYLFWIVTGRLTKTKPDKLLETIIINVCKSSISCNNKRKKNT